MVSGSNVQATDVIEGKYSAIIPAGTYRAESINVAEAAKVIENTQRDLNIALMNELAIIFNRLGLDTEAVLKTAGTKWNFLPFRPGLGGGHCISVDPYYLTHKVEQSGYHPQIILAGRRLIDEMGTCVAGQLVKAMPGRRIQVNGARVLVLGLTFKENCPDLRNTRVIDVIQELQETPDAGVYDAIVIAVAHDQFRQLGAETLRGYGRADHVRYDLKSLLGVAETDLRL